MKNKKIVMYVVIILLLLFIIWIGLIIVKNQRNQQNKTIDEYVPQEEISEEQFRQTNVILYFYNNKTGELGTEIRKIDSKELLENPENKLIEYLIEGPNNEDLSKLIPENTKLLNSEIKKETLYINFSEEFKNNENLIKEQKKNIIDSILKTVSQLNEINKIIILVNGEEF